MDDANNSAAKRTKDELKDSEEWYRNLVEGSFDGIFIRKDGQIVFANSRLYEMLGYDEQELQALDLWGIYHPDDRQIVEDRAEARFNDVPVPPRYDVRLMRKDGTSFPAELDARVGFFGGDQAIQVCVRDISERKRAEEERLRLVTAIEQAVEIIFIADADGRIRYINPSFELITGYSRSETLGRNARTYSRHKDNSAVYDQMWKTLDSGSVWNGRFVMRRLDGTALETEATVSPVRDETGNVVSFVGVMRDVTNEVALENQLRQAQKMQAIGTLAGGIAHDFNNIIWVIIGFAEILLQESEPDSHFRECLQQVLQAAERARDLVKQILTFSRPSDTSRAPLDLGSAIKHGLKWMKSTIPATIEIRESISPDLRTVMADPTQIDQVLMNLVTNAAHALRETGGTLDVRLENMEYTAGLGRPLQGLRDGPYVKMTIEDNGPGMSSDILERIFEPYFSTKRPDQGTGLGLAVVHGIAKGHGGAITARSLPGKGSVFEVYLPAISRKPALHATATEILPTGNERVLVVDDEDSARRLGCDLLEAMGYRVRTSKSPMEALHLFRSAPDQFDLVITDMTMPGTNGVDLTRDLLCIRRDLPVVIWTGFSDLMSDEEIRALGAAAILVKPISRTQLAKTVREVLDRAKQP